MGRMRYKLVVQLELITKLKYIYVRKFLPLYARKINVGSPSALYTKAYNGTIVTRILKFIKWCFDSDHSLHMGIITDPRRNNNRAFVTTNYNDE